MCLVVAYFSGKLSMFNVCFRSYHWSSGIKQSFISQVSCPCQPSTFFIMKTYLYNFDPLKPHFYIVKLGFAGVYIIFLISAQNIDCGYSLELPHRGGSNKYPQSMF